MSVYILIDFTTTSLSFKYIKFVKKNIAKDRFELSTLRIVPKTLLSKAQKIARERFVFQHSYG